MKPFTTISILSLILISSPAVHADLLLGLEFDDTSTAKSISSGDTVFIDMFLTDDGVGGFTTLPTFGLLGAGGQLVQTAGTATAISAGVPTLGTNAAPNFDPLSLIQPAVGGIDDVLVAASILPFPPFIDPVGVGSTTIQIARFALTVTGAAGETATIASGVLGGGFMANFTDAGEDLDALLVATGPTAFGSVTVAIASTAAIPEPSSYLAASLLASGWFWWRRRASHATENRSLDG